MFLEIQSGDDRLLEIIKKKSQPYFERGMDAVIEQRPLRTFEEAVSIIKPRLLESGASEWLAEACACVYARCYIAGIVAAARLVALDLVALFEPCLEGEPIPGPPLQKPCGTISAGWDAPPPSTMQ